MRLKDIFQFIEEKGKTVVLFLIPLVVLLLMIVFWQFFQNKPQDVAPAVDVYEELLAEDSEEGEVETIRAKEEKEEKEAEEKPVPTEIVVDVKGAVEAPGVYTMAANNRIVDAIEKAGGLTEVAEQKAVNLAQVVEDQMVIYVPEVGEEGVDLVHLNQEAVGEEDTSTNIVNINTAKKEALMTLSGIGSSKADSILSYREENGNFQTIEDIKNVSGIGDATFANLQEFISVGP